MSFYNNINPTLIEIGPFSIRYYGLVYVVGFLIATFFLMKLAKSEKIKNITEDNTIDLMIYIILGGILGARLAHILIEFNYYFANPLEIVMLWHGGMAFIGGLLGAVLAIYIFSKKYKIKFYEIADFMVIPFAFFLCLGRIANFINSEFFGRPTNVPWCVYFQNAVGCRHPSQIYEAAKNFLIFGVLLVLYIHKDKKRLKDGFIFWMFVTLYGLLRFVTNFFREDTLYFRLSIGQWMSLIMFVAGLFVLIRKYINYNRIKDKKQVKNKKSKKKGRKNETNNLS
jgi:phosphatidylglycerol---prolipoprotein diacylglyceryl transferase